MIRDRQRVLREWREAETRLKAARTDDGEVAAEVDRLRREYQELSLADPGAAADLARPPHLGGATDRELDTRSRQLLSMIEDVRRLEREKRTTVRSSARFHELAEEIEQKARRMFELTAEQRVGGTVDSPIDSERRDKRPGDWTSGSRPANDA